MSRLPYLKLLTTADWWSALSIIGVCDTMLLTASIFSVLTKPRGDVLGLVVLFLIVQIPLGAFAIWIKVTERTEQNQKELKEKLCQHAEGFDTTT